MLWGVPYIAAEPPSEYLARHIPGKTIDESRYSTTGLTKNPI
jgi:hypothetical protein